MSFTTFLESFINQKTTEIQMGMVCKIEKFDADKMRADAKPYLKIENELEETADFPIITDIPVMFFYGDEFAVKPSYAKGDMVWVGFATHDIEDALKEYSRTASKKTFELQNACVIGGIVKDGFTFSNPYTIKKESNYIAIGKDEAIHEPVVKAQTFDLAYTVFITALSTLVGGDMAANATAITAIGAAAKIMLPQIGTWDSIDTKVS